MDILNTFQPELKKQKNTIVCGYKNNFIDKILDVEVITTSNQISTTSDVTIKINFKDLTSFYYKRRVENIISDSQKSYLINLVKKYLDLSNNL